MKSVRIALSSIIAVVVILFSVSSAHSAEMESRLVAIYEADAADLPGHVYEILYGADINEDGLLLFRGRSWSFPSGERRQAVWKEIAPGQVVLVGSDGPQSPAPGFEFGKPLNALWDTSDTLTVEWPDKPEGTLVNAIWRFEYAPESAQRLASAGDAGPVPATSIGLIANTVNQTNLWRSNARKDIAFVGTLVDDDTQVSTGALFFKSENGAVELVAREGSAASGGGQFFAVFDKIFTTLMLAPDGSLWFQALILDGNPNPVRRIFLYRNGTTTDISSMGTIPAPMMGDNGLVGLTFCSVNSSGNIALLGASDLGQGFVASANGNSVSLHWLEPFNRAENKIDGPSLGGGHCRFTDSAEVIVGGLLISGGYTIFHESVFAFSAGGAVRTIIEGTKPVAAIPGAVYRNIAGSLFDVNSKGQIALMTEIEGAGIDSYNNEVILLGTGTDDFVVVARRGQLREIRPGVEAPILNLTAFGTGALTGQANSLAENGDVAYGASIDNKGALFVSSPAQDILSSGFEDPPNMVVNSIADGTDIVMGDGKCETGLLLPNGNPECTLRAAIEELNAKTSLRLVRFAIPGTAPHIIQPASPLPNITRDDAYFRGPPLQADVPQVVIDGSAGGGIDGLVVDASSVRFERLAIRGFNSDGIDHRSGGQLTLSSMYISENCGFGVYSAGLVRLDAGGGSPSLLNDNGKGNGCEGGGIFSASVFLSSRSVDVSNSTISNNNGPGIISGGPVWLEKANIENNAAQGVTVQGDGANIYLRDGNTYIAGNRGNGVETSNGDFDVDATASVDIRLNRGWGLVTGLDGRIIFGSAQTLPTQTSYVLFNASAGGNCTAWTIQLAGLDSYTAACVGGGINAHSEPSIAHRLASLVVEDNGGPGLATMFHAKLRNVTIQRNKGPGIFAYYGTGSGPLDVPLVTAEVGFNEISANLGHGIMADYGKVIVNKGINLNVRDNSGWGIVLQRGVAELGVSNDNPAVSRIIRGNGFGTECFEWIYDDITDSVLPDSTHSGACPGGGVYSSDDRSATSFFDATTISGNNGPGILTEARVKLSRSIISENESSGINVVDANNATSSGDLMVYSSLGANEIFSNKGHGIHVQTGSVELEESLSMELNLGVGVLLEQGDVDMLPASGDAEKSIQQHGPGGACRLWDIPDVGLWSSTVVTCSSAGILVMDGNITGRLLIIKANSGDGLNASGNMTLIDSTVCDNTGSQIVTGGTETLTNVTTVCN